MPGVEAAVGAPVGSVFPVGAVGVVVQGEEGGFIAGGGGGCGGCGPCAGAFGVGGVYLYFVLGVCCEVGDFGVGGGAGVGVAVPVGVGGFAVLHVVVGDGGAVAVGGFPCDVQCVACGCDAQCRRVGSVRSDSRRRARTQLRTVAPGGFGESGGAAQRRFVHIQGGQVEGVEVCGYRPG